MNKETRPKIKFNLSNPSKGAAIRAPIRFNIPQVNRSVPGKREPEVCRAHAFGRPKGRNRDLDTGDRVGQMATDAATTYALDMDAGLTQVLLDGTRTHLYGNGRSMR